MADDFKDISHLYKVTPSAKTIIDGEDLVETKQKSKAYAWCDVLQSVTGLILGLFLFCHMGFTSSILLGKDTFWSLVSLTGGYFIDGVDHLWMHSVFVGVIFVLVVIHAILALRKFPNNYKAFRIMRGTTNCSVTLTQQCGGFSSSPVLSSPLWSSRTCSPC